MTEEQPGFRVTLKDVYTDVQELKRIIAERLPDDLPARVRKVEIQIAAQWVVVGLVVAGIGALLGQAFIK